jgi:hypothetical protein
MYHYTVIRQSGATIKIEALSLRDAIISAERANPLDRVVAVCQEDEVHEDRTVRS